MEAKETKLVPNPEFRGFLESGASTARVGDRMLCRIPVPEFDVIDYGERFEVVADVRQNFTSPQAFADTFFLRGASAMLLEVMALRDIVADVYYHPHWCSDDLWAIDDGLTCEDVGNERPLIEKIEVEASAAIERRRLYHSASLFAYKLAS